MLPPPPPQGPTARRAKACSQHSDNDVTSKSENSESEISVTAAVATRSPLPLSSTWAQGALCFDAPLVLLTHERAMPDAVIEHVIHAANVWDRSEAIPYGAPPKETLEPRRRSAGPQSTVKAALVRRNPTPLQARMLRKTRNFALAKFDQVPAHQEQAAISDWVEVEIKPPREAAEVRAEWVVAALRRSNTLPEEASVAGMERRALPEGFERATGEGVIERLGLDYREPAESWPTSLVLKMPTFGGGADSLSIGQQERYHLAELTFLTDCAHNTEHAMKLPSAHWHFLRPPGEGELRTHWKWARGVPVYEHQYPYEIGEYACLMEDLYDQPACVDGAMEREQVDAIVKALAALHAAFWEREEILENPCFKSTRTVKMSDVKDIVQGLLDRSQLPEHVASLLIPAAEMRNELLIGTMQHGRTLTRGVAGASVSSWRIAPDGCTASSMTYGHTCVGVGTRDLALLLSLCLSKEQQEDWTLELRQLYYDTLIGDGVDAAVYTQEIFDSDYQVMLWDVAFEHLIASGRELLAMPTLSKDTAYRERKRVMDLLAVPQGVISACCRALQLGEAWKAVGVEESSEEDD